MNLIRALLESEDLILKFLGLRCISTALDTRTDEWKGEFKANRLKIFKKLYELIMLIKSSIETIYLMFLTDKNENNLLFYIEYIKYTRCLEVLVKWSETHIPIDFSNSLNRFVLIVNQLMDILRSNNFVQGLKFLKKESSIEKVYDLTMKSDDGIDEFLKKINNGSERLDLIVKQRSELFELKQKLIELRQKLEGVEEKKKRLEIEVSVKTQMILEKDNIIVKYKNQKNTILIEKEHVINGNFKKSKDYLIDESNPNVDEYFEILRNELIYFSMTDRIGHLDNLSEKLYSSPTHFISEIIQNADDCEYPLKTSIKTLKIVLRDDNVTFCINEKGFNSSAVRALCSFGKSNKIRGKHTGCKGIGFKSVFSCTDIPIIYSSPWNFYFEKKIGNDI